MTRAAGIFLKIAFFTQEVHSEHVIIYLREGKVVLSLV